MKSPLLQSKKIAGPACRPTNSSTPGRGLRLKIDVQFKFGAILFLILVGLISQSNTLFAQAYECGASEHKETPTTIEITLAQRWKGHNEEVRKALSADSESIKTRIRFFPFLTPPANIGIGKCITADDGRRAIREAIRYNGGVDKLIIQEMMPHHWIKIGATDLAELTWIPVPPEALSRLIDPSLSTEAFQELYRKLAVQKEMDLPFGMGSQKREKKSE